MTVASTIAFAFAMFVLAATPGPAFFAVSTRALTSGTRSGMGMILGVLLGDLIYFSLALFGMASVAEGMGETFIWIKLAGGIYLVWMGYKLWFQAPISADETQTAPSTGLMKNIVEGLIINLANPKVIIFFAAIVPSFVDLVHLTGFDVAVLISIIMIVGLSVDTLIVLLAVRARRLLRTDTAQRRLNRLGGATLAGVGIAVAIR